MDELQDYFQKLGLEPEIAALYRSLHSHGPQTISQLARTSGVERTRIYRLLDEIAASNLVEIETGYKRHIFKAAPITNVQILLSKKEQELKNLQQELNTISSHLERGDNRSPFTHVQFYRGPEGLKQMFWNQTKGKGEQVCILYETLQVRTLESFFERWVRAFNERGISGRGIVGDHFLKSQHQWYSTHTNERIARWQSRYVPPELFPITHSTVVYNDVVAYQSWKDGEVFGVEIYNQDIANAQRQFFEMLWTQAKPVKIKVKGEEIVP